MDTDLAYPRVLYHPTEQPRVVADAIARLTLGQEWSDSPYPAEEPEPDRLQALNARIEALERAVFAAEETKPSPVRRAKKA